jgi:hypothetical protein
MGHVPRSLKPTLTLTWSNLMSMRPFVVDFELAMLVSLSKWLATVRLERWLFFDRGAGGDSGIDI